MVCAFDMSLSVKGSLCRKCSSPSATTMCQDHLENVEGAEDRRVTFTRQNPGPELKVAFPSISLSLSKACIYVLS